MVHRHECRWHPSFVRRNSTGEGDDWEIRLKTIFSWKEGEADCCLFFFYCNFNFREKSETDGFGIIGPWRQAITQLSVWQQKIDSIRFWSNRMWWEKPIMVLEMPRSTSLFLDSRMPWRRKSPGFSAFAAKNNWISHFVYDTISKKKERFCLWATQLLKKNTKN